MKVMMLSNQARSLAIFWRVLMQMMQARGMEVSACVPSEKNGGLPPDVRVISYSLDRKGINPLNDMQTLRQLRTIFNREKPDILFATTIKPVIYGCLAAKWAEVPNIFATITGLGYAFECDTPFKKLINIAGRSLYRAALSHISGVFFQNHDDWSVFREQKIITSATPVFFANGTGVDTSYFAQAPIPSGAPVFILVARLLKAKGIFEYAAAARMLKTHFPDARFHLLGPPETGRGALTKAEIRRLAPAVEYLGQADDVRPYMAAAHVAVLPSWREGLPTALMEAMSMGRPLVATDVPGCREVIKNGENGFLAAVKNPASLAKAMRKFLDEPTICQRMGQASRHLALEQFDATKVANGILDNMARQLQ